MKPREVSEIDAPEVAGKLGGATTGEATKGVRDWYAETSPYTRFPRIVRGESGSIALSTDSPGRSARVRVWSAPFPWEVRSLPVTARFKCVVDGEADPRRHLDVTLLEGGSMVLLKKHKGVRQ